METDSPSNDEPIPVNEAETFEAVSEPTHLGPPVPYPPQRWGTRPYSASLSPFALPTATLRELRQIDPEMAREAFQMVKDEAAHRREQERQESAAAIEIAKSEASARIEDMRSGYMEARIGQFCAVTIGVVLIAGASYMGTHGAQILGGLLGAGGITTVITPFLLGRKNYRQPETLPEKVIEPEPDQLKDLDS